MSAQNTRIKTINKVTIVGSFVNLLLTAGKICAGILGKSSAMVADGVHSLSDLVTDIVLIAFVRVSGKERDENHKYGHGKYETFATMLVSFALMIVGIGIFWTGANKVIDSLHGAMIEQPSIIALYAATASIISKEALFWYTKIVGKKIKSTAVIENAWHHRSDAFSSIGTALGISGAIFLGEQWRILDPIAGIIVSLFILKVAWKIAHPSVNELLETSLPKKTEQQIARIIMNHKGVKNFHNLRTRKIGNAIAADVHIKIDKNHSIESAHDIATDIEKSIRKKFGKESNIVIHTEPY